MSENRSAVRRVAQKARATSRSSGEKVLRRMRSRTGEDVQAVSVLPPWTPDSRGTGAVSIPRFWYAFSEREARVILKGRVTRKLRRYLEKAITL